MNKEKLEEKLNTGRENIRQISMTKDEKKNILENVLGSSPFCEHPVKSPYLFLSFMAKINKNRLAYYGSLSCLMLILGSGVVFASGDSLPGDILYRLKVGIIEPARSALTFSSEAKAEYASTLARERLTEAETLMGRGKLDSQKEEKLNSLLSEHASALDNALDKIHKKQKSNGDTDDTVDNIAVNFETEMEAHAKVLDTLENNEEKKEQPWKGKISENARTNGNKIRDKFENKQKSNAPLKLIEKIKDKE